MMAEGARRTGILTLNGFAAEVPCAHVTRQQPVVGQYPRQRIAFADSTVVIRCGAQTGPQRFSSRLAVIRRQSPITNRT